MPTGNTSGLKKKTAIYIPLIFYTHMRWYFEWFEKGIFPKALKQRDLIEKNYLGKNGDHSMTASAAIPAEINSPNSKRQLLSWNNMKEKIIASVETQSWSICFLSTFWKYHLSFGQICNGNPPTVTVGCNLDWQKTTFLTVRLHRSMGCYLQRTFFFFFKSYYFAKKPCNSFGFFYYRILFCAPFVILIWLSNPTS